MKLTSACIHLAGCPEPAVCKACGECAFVAKIYDERPPESAPVRPTVVRDIGRKNLADIAGRLRELADWAEKNPEAVRTVIVISAAHASVVSVHGYGERCSGVEALGWLDLAMHRVRSDRESAALDFGPDGAA